MWHIGAKATGNAKPVNGDLGKGFLLILRQKNRIETLTWLAHIEFF